MVKQKEKKEKVEVKTISKTNGIPMTEESYEEWVKAFTDMEECFEYLKKQK